MSNLSALFGGGGRYSHFVKLTGAGVWTVPTGVQMLRVVMVSAGGGGGGLCIGNAASTTYNLNFPLTSTLSLSILYSGGGGAFAEFDYPILGRATFPYGVGTGGIGAQTTAVAATLTSNASLTQNSTSSGCYDVVLNVSAATVNALKGTCPVASTLATYVSTAASTITLSSAPASFGAVAGWYIVVAGTPYLISSINGTTVTIATPFGTAASAGTYAYLCPMRVAGGLYLPAASFFTTGLAILSGTSLLCYYFYSGALSSTIASGTSLIASVSKCLGTDGGATTFGDYTVNGGSGAATAAGVAMGSLYAGSQGTTVSAGSTVLTAGYAGNTVYTVPATGLNGGYVPAPLGKAYGIGGGGVPGTNNGAGGISGGGAAGVPSATISTAVNGGNGGDGLLLLFY